MKFKTDNTVIFSVGLKYASPRSSFGGETCSPLPIIRLVRILDANKWICLKKVQTAVCPVRYFTPCDMSQHMTALHSTTRHLPEATCRCQVFAFSLQPTQILSEFHSEL
jgi:hypothetical protein